VSEEGRLHRGERLLLLAAAGVVVVWGVHLAQEVLVFFLVAAFFAMLGTPPVLWLERKGVPSAGAVLIVVGSMVAMLLVVGASVGASVNGFYTEAPAYQERLQSQARGLQVFLVAHGVRGMDKVLLGYLNPGAVMSLTANLLSGLGSALSNIVLVLLTIGFILFEASSFPVKLRAVLGDPWQVFPQFTRFVSDLERYVVIKTLVSLAVGLLVGVWLAILGVDFPVIWGFLAFLLNYVPNVGATLAAIPPVLLAFVQLGLGWAVAAAAGLLAVHLVIGNVVEMKLMGRRLHLSTLVVFLSLMFWGSLLGPVGMVLCVPLTMTVKFACENDPGTRWIAVLLGPEVPAGATPSGRDEQATPAT
jgi:predicted PurR-regulated permease PerM